MTNITGLHSLLKYYMAKRQVFNTLKYGKGEKGKLRFNPSPFNTVYEDDSFSYQDFLELRNKYKQKDLIKELEVININIKRLKEEIKLNTPKSSIHKAPYRYIKPIQDTSNKDILWGVMDIETKKSESGEEVAYAWGVKIDTFEKITISDDVEGIITDLEYITNIYNQERKIVLFLHNLAKFDSFFIIKALSKGNYSIDILKSSQGFINIKTNINNVSISFNDSFLLIPAALRDIAKSFRVKTQKGFFPYDIMNKYGIEYEGEKPEIHNFPNISKEEYDALPEKIILMDLLKEYLLSDLRCLYEILTIFKAEIKEEYNIILTQMITLPQLAFTIWRKKYLDWSTVGLLQRATEEDIRKSYYGGAAEVYRPRCEIGWIYDVNSMYPYAMTKPLPIGHPSIKAYYKYINEIPDGDLFGFYKAEIKCQKGVYAPILPRRYEGHLLFATGKWVGWYFSEELKNAFKTGCYEIKILIGYKFKAKEGLLTNFVEEFYKKKKTRDPVKRSIAKLILNSLYGRLGMKPITEYSVFTKDDGISMGNLKDVIDLGEYGNIYTFNNENYAIKSNVAIASAITAYSRMYAFNIINEYSDSIVYHDTDSFVLNKPIDKKYLGNGLGQLKNVIEDENYTFDKDEQYFIRKGFFVSPKIYTYNYRDDKNVTKIKSISKDKQKKENIERLYQNIPLKIPSLQFNRIKNKLNIIIEYVYKTLRIRDNRRKKLYNKSGEWVGTASYNKNGADE